MSDVFDGQWGYEPDDPDNPFYGLDGFDRLTNEPDPMERIEREVLDQLGVSSFDEILITSDDRSLENARGNRFESIIEAITYLFDAGVLQFSGVVFEGDEVEIEIEPCTDGNC